MKKILIAIIILFVLPMNIYGMTTSAKSVILMDQKSHRILYSENMHSPMLIASITKIMTAVIAIESEKLDDLIKINESVLKAYGSAIYIEVGEEIIFRDLVYGLMLRSGNDAALAIMDYLGDDTFISLMNKKGKEIGMKNTTFNNPHGLDESGGNYSTVYDMAILTSYAMELEEYKKIVGTSKHVVKTNKKTYVWHNKNKLLNTYKYCTGGKTGFTKKARRTLVTTASKDDLDLVVVTINDSNDFFDHVSLHEYGFKNYKYYTVLEKNSFDVNEDYFFKDELYISSSYGYPLLESEKEALITKIILNKKRSYKTDDVVGNLEILFKGKVVYNTDIKVKIDEEVKKGFFSKIFDFIFGLN